MLKPLDAIERLVAAGVARVDITKAIRFSGVNAYQNEPPLNSSSKVDKSTP